MNNDIVTVFCASSNNCNSNYLDNAFELGRLIAGSGRKIIYGGGKTGLMGRLAEGVLAENGSIRGIIPKLLNTQELSHNGITKLTEVETLHERESIMLLESKCIIALPGGVGTFSELMQAIAWKFLQIINSPIIIVNICNYFESILKMLELSMKEGFLRLGASSLWTAVNNIEECMLSLDNELPNRYRLNNNKNTDINYYV